MCLKITLYVVITAILAWDVSRAAVYMYFVLRTISYIISQGSILCISVAYAVAPRQSENRSCSSIVLEVLQDRWNSMKDTIFVFSNRFLIIVVPLLSEFHSFRSSTNWGCLASTVSCWVCFMAWHGHLG
ncbi:hypothetical protein BHE74_00019211 [Ensete ventricosum]|nr:hypothetical protein BHE74_00019211 [Ensete ventricosum]RZR96983.1 hypothetical protein BHM03_00026109 [Ensete ventricosum]